LSLTPLITSMSSTSTHYAYSYLHRHAIDLITLGKAYVDDTPQETMRAERMVGTASKNRDASVETNLAKFQMMKDATPEGLTNWLLYHITHITYSLRAKMSIDDKNKALRDPVIYRTNLIPHIKTGDTWKIYPTYDFVP